MASQVANSKVKKCQLCRGKIDWWCNNCEMYLCVTCLMNHKKTTRGHSYISSDDVTHNNILAQWNVRCINGSIIDIMGRLEHVKTVEYLSCEPYRLGLVHNNIWLRCSDVNTFAVHDQDLKQIVEHKYLQIEGDINTVQQINRNDVIVTADKGVFLFDIHGNLLYQILKGMFTDISIDGEQAVAVECQKNKIVFLNKQDNIWQEQRSFIFEDQDDDTKTIQMVNGDILLGLHWSSKLIKLDKRGNVLKTYGAEQGARKMANFDGPLISGVDAQGCVVVCDQGNGRFKVLDSDGRWQEVKIKGVKAPKDILIIDKFAYILHYEKIGTKIKYKISKFEIKK